MYEPFSKEERKSVVGLLDGGLLKSEKALRRYEATVQKLEERVKELEEQLLQATQTLSEKE